MSSENVLTGKNKRWKDMYRFFLESTYYRPAGQSSGISITGPGWFTVLVYTGAPSVVFSDFVTKTRKPFMRWRHDTPVKTHKYM